MNAIRILSSEPWVERLGWTLLHFLWQGFLIAAVYGAARRWVARSATPNARYLLGCAAMAAMAAAPLATWSALRQASVPLPISTHIPAPAPAATTATGAALPALPPTAYRAWLEPLLPWVVALWLAGAVAFWLRLMSSCVFAIRLRHALVRPAPCEWQQALGRLQARIRVTRPVRLLVSALVEAPAVVGWLRPVVLAPVGALAGLPPEQVEALLLHELAHIRRHDYLVNILQSAVEALLFYHPAVWWISGHIRAERELCCDDLAVAASGDVLTYARALAEWEASRPSHLSAVMAATGGSLVDRIARLLGQSRPASRTLPGPAAIVGAILLVITALGAFGQPAARPKFEVASIKPSQENRFMAVRAMPGGRLTADAPLRLLMQNAYSLQSFQIVGGPAWISSDHYEIDARGDSSANRPQVFLMLQTLLEDRFQLKTHRETRELPVYALVAAKNGAKLPAPKEGGCVTAEPGAPPPPPPGRGQPMLVPCGRLRIMGEPTGARIEGGQIAMPELTRILSTIMGRPVVDKTGIAQTFDVRLEFTPDATTAGMSAMGPPGAFDGAPPPDNAGPSIFSAIQEQLGLKLESAKGPVEVLVIDHVERPSAN